MSFLSTGSPTSMSVADRSVTVATTTHTPRRSCRRWLRSSRSCALARRRTGSCSSETATSRRLSSCEPSYTRSRPPRRAGTCGVRPVCADRASYESQQAALLHVLHGAEHPLAGFSDDDLAAASESLLRKRAHAVREHWPALTQCLGSRFLVEYKRYAATTPPPAAGEGVADGLQ